MVEVELGGVARRLSFDLNATIALAELTGEDIGEVIGRIIANGDKELPEAETEGERIERKKALAIRNLDRVKAIRLITWAALATDCPDFVEDPKSLALVGSWLTMPKISEVSAAISKLLAAMVGPLEFEGQLAPFVPTPAPVVARMVELAEIADDSLVLDMGAGDGRLMFAAAEAAERVLAVGYEMHAERLSALREKVSVHKCKDRVAVSALGIEQALDSPEIARADAVFLYLLDTSNMLLRDRLRERMKPGARLVSHDFSMGDWKPDTTVKVECEDRTHTVYVWRIPER